MALLSVTAPDVHVYLLIGQSNMAGRGAIGDEDRTPHPRVIALDANGTWGPAVEPITVDARRKAGTGPGLAFGKRMAERDPLVTVGLIPCAVGGTSLARWQKGGLLYANAVKRARLAARTGALTGVLWHQGESDTAPALASAYAARLDQLIHDLRADLESGDILFVAGQIGEFLYPRNSKQGEGARVVNAALATLPERVPRTAVVSSAGLTHTGDCIHFDAASQRELGRRFADATICVRSGHGQ